MSDGRVIKAGRMVPNSITSTSQELSTNPMLVNSLIPNDILQNISQCVTLVFDNECT